MYAIRSYYAAVSDVSVAASTDYAGLESAINVSLRAVKESGSVVYQSDGLPMRGQIVKRIPEMIEAAGGEVEMSYNFV